MSFEEKCKLAYQQAIEQNSLLPFSEIGDEARKLDLESGNKEDKNFKIVNKLETKALYIIHDQLTKLGKW